MMMARNTNSPNSCEEFEEIPETLIPEFADRAMA
jgi:hypothetical protein